MAKATNVIVEVKPATAAVHEEKINLVLSLDEADAVRTLLGQVGGSGEFCNLTSDVFWALDDRLVGASIRSRFYEEARKYHV